MKKALNVILFSIISAALLSQNFIADNYQNFVDSDNSTVVQVHGPSFQLAAAFMAEADGEDAEQIKEALSTIKSFQLVTVPELTDPVAEYSNGLKKVGSGFDELITVKDKEGRFSLHIDEEDGVVYEIIGLGAVPEEGRFLAFSLNGEIPLEMIGEIMNTVQVKSGKNFSEMIEGKDIEATSIKVYPNPTTVDNNVTVEIPEHMLGGEGLMVDLNGKVISKFEITGQRKEITTAGISPGYYFISLTKDGTTVKRKVNVIR